MTTNELRNKFLKFFAARNHKILPGAPLIPQDPSTLLTSAGMQQFMDAFRRKTPAPAPRVATCQKCARADDIEKVGYSIKYHTFFEMPGNFSFGDYFKAEAIAWAWGLITHDLGIPKERLWVSVYKEDDEAYNIWHHKINMSAERIVKLGKDDNWWVLSSGIGPCGPCSEIFIDMGEKYGCGQPTCQPGCGCDRYVELWNLVFQTFDADEQGNLSPLPTKNIDTGLGLERVAMVLQGVSSDFEIDIFKPILNYIIQIADEASDAGFRYKDDKGKEVSIKVIADHIRAVTFLIADGVIPSNEGRGYVLRRILRRAYRFGRKIGIYQPYLYRIIPTVTKLMSEPYPELKEKETATIKIVKREEQNFQETLQQGMNLLEQVFSDLKSKNQNIIPGEQVFKLYDTYGLPPDITAEIAREEGLKIDQKGFQAIMEEQKKRTQVLPEKVTVTPTFELSAIPKTEFLGYDRTMVEAKILALLKDERLVEFAQAGEFLDVILDQTPFYPESGGQIGDVGKLTAKELEAEITDAKKTEQDIILHKVKILKGQMAVGDTVDAKIDTTHRLANMRAHTATHLLHWALRTTLGTHVTQSGSLVEPDRLRFDFSHFQKLQPPELKKIEELINTKILEGLPVQTFHTSLAEAKKIGALAFFGEKYTEPVRVVKIDPISLELCGGTHVTNTSQIGLCKIISESSIGAGIRRIETLTGPAALQHIKQEEEILNKLTAKLATNFTKLPQKIDGILTDLKQAKKEIEKLQIKNLDLQLEKILTKATAIKDTKIITQEFKDLGLEVLRSLSDKLIARLQPGALILANCTPTGATLICRVSEELVEKGLHADKIINQVAKIINGGGGGRADFAQAGGKNPEKIKHAFAKFTEIVKEFIE